MASVLPQPLMGISPRDQVSLGLSALIVACSLFVAQFKLTPDADDVMPIMSLTTEVLQEQNKLQRELLPKSQVPSPKVANPSKESLVEAVTKVDDNPNVTAVAANAKPSQAVAMPSVSSPEVKRVDVDSDFESHIRRLIESAKRYPTGREASLQKPQGVVVACVILQRDGSLQEVKVQKTSTYPILDSAAKRLLANLQYPAMTQDMFVGHLSHMFCVNLDYKVPA